MENDVKSKFYLGFVIGQLLWKCPGVNYMMGLSLFRYAYISAQIDEILLLEFNCSCNSISCGYNSFHHYNERIRGCKENLPVKPLKFSCIYIQNGMIAICY